MDDNPPPASPEIGEARDLFAALSTDRADTRARLAHLDAIYADTREFLLKHGDADWLARRGLGEVSTRSGGEEVES